MDSHDIYAIYQDPRSVMRRDGELDLHKVKVLCAAALLARGIDPEAPGDRLKPSPGFGDPLKIARIKAIREETGASLVDAVKAYEVEWFEAHPDVKRDDYAHHLRSY